MTTQKTTFALFFGNRSFFPASLQASARREMTQTLQKLGYKTIALDPRATRHGAVQTPDEGEVYADFLRKNHGKFGGIILSLPNFGDESGAIAALKDAGVPILIQAFPDELDKMAPALRRDAFCGKFSIMDVFTQYGVKFTVLPPHTVHPSDKRFADQMDYFDRLCRVYNGLKNMVVGAIGARTTAFKTVRIDELALQRNGITMETLDLSDIFARVKALKNSDPRLKQKAKILQAVSSWKGVPKQAFHNLARTGVVLDAVISEYGMNAVAIRCWEEFQKQLGISPCILLGLLNDSGIPTSCEVDVGNAVTMHALRQASGNAATCLDWNNNYGEEDEKCILFHCGPVPPSMMTAKGRISDHGILCNALGKGNGFGCNVGRIKPAPFTFGSMLTSEGELHFYLGEGQFTDDRIADDFFGCAGVAEIPNLQEALQTIGYLGHRHHVSCTTGHVIKPLLEALTRYLGYDVTTV